MSDKMKITIEILNTGLEEDILRKGEWEDDSLFGRSLRNALMHFTKESSLDKLKSEIKGMTPTYHNPDWSITDLVPISEVLKLVDKYKAESEEI